MVSVINVISGRKSMSEESNKSLVPHFTIGTIVLVIVLAVVFWPNESAPQRKPTVVTQDPSAVEVTPIEPPTIEEPIAELSEPTQIQVGTVPEAFEADISSELEPVLEPVLELEPEPLDTSDGAVKTKLLALSDYNAFARLLVNEALLERFVVMTNTLVDEDLSANNRLLVEPEKPFRTYRQADKEWIDPASYKRYAPYVDVFESLEAESLVQLYQEYKPAIEQIFSEIASPYANFDEKLEEAIEVLLDTPEVPMPVEIFTDSVMYKFVDSQLESLSAPQKQLLRTGPENMRRIKAKLREIKELL
jgi:hypothetical protein